MRVEIKSLPRYHSNHYVTLVHNSLATIVSSKPSPLLSSFVPQLSYSSPVNQLFSTKMETTMVAAMVV
jgi:hypothetical protein